MVAIRWAIGWVIAVGLMGSIALEASVVGPISGAIAGMIGVGVMFWQFSLASHDA